MWSRHGGLHPPSAQAVRNLCTQLLPLLEMYCRWELQEDCTDLRALMQRFDLESDLESHELGRSLLFMIRDEETHIDRFPEHVPIIARENPFDAIRDRLSVLGMAIQDLRPQVNLTWDFAPLCAHYCEFIKTSNICLHMQTFFACQYCVCALQRLHYHLYQ